MLKSMQQKETKFIVKRSAAYIDSKFGCCPHGNRFGYGLTRHDDFRKNAKLSGHMLDAARRLTLVLKFDNILSIRRSILLESISESAGSISLIIFPTFIYTLSNILEKNDGVSNGYRQGRNRKSINVISITHSKILKQRMETK